MKAETKEPSRSSAADVPQFPLGADYSDYFQKVPQPTGFWLKNRRTSSGGVQGRPRSRSSLLRPESRRAAGISSIGCVEPPAADRMLLQRRWTMEIKVRKATRQEMQNKGVLDWPTWECEASTFPWHYDEQEQCYFLDGQVTVEAEGQTVSFGKGDFVVFPQGMDCTWKVSQPVRKHYKFG